MKHENYSVWKDTTAYSGFIWKLQMPKGILSYKTKRKALQVASALKASVTPSGKGD